MKKFFKSTVLFLLVGILSTATFSILGCGKNGGNIVRNDRTINVKAYKGGYGTTYLYSLAEKFEEAYKEQGYKVNIIKPSADMTGAMAAREMYDVNGDWADIYFAPLAMTRTGVYGPDYTNNGENPLFADITDTVWNKPAIGFDGKEEDVNISEKYNFSAGADEQFCIYKDRVYCLSGGMSVGAFIVNTKKLAKYGFTELPKTSNELFEMFEAIQAGTNKNIKPLTYIGSQNGYHLHVSHVWFAQYTGAENYDKFWSYTDENGEWNIEKGYEVYDDKGLDEMMYALYKMYDPEYAAKGSGSNTLALAHAKIMLEDSGAVFMSDGDWAYNEIIVDYPNQIDDIVFMNIPVISALGTKLFGEGTSYNFNDEKCEEILSYVIGKIDEGKTENEIVSLAQSEKSWVIALKDVEEVMRARGIYCNRGKEGANICICDRSPNKDIAELFLRMYFSDDNAVLYNTCTNGYLTTTRDFSKMKQNKYSSAYINVMKNKYAYGIYAVTKGLREQIGPNGLLAKSGTYLVNEIILEGVSAYNDQGVKIKTDKEAYTENAKKRIAEDRKVIKDNWRILLADANII